MQIVALDTSLTSTACTIYDSNSQYHFISWRKNLDIDNIWNQSMLPFTTMHNVTYQETKNFTIGEVYKLEDYLKLSAEVSNVIHSHLDPKLPVKVLMEGYSQKSKAGNDHDLVAYGTLIRLKMYSKYNSLNIIPPKSLKKFAAQITYPTSGVGKKNIVYRNKAGKAGGSFDKFDMFQAIVDYSNNDRLSKWCNLNWKDIKTRSSIPKPADDLVDAFWLCEVGKLGLV